MHSDPDGERPAAAGAEPADDRTSGPAPSPPYLPIAEHGVIGDLRTAALVGTDARIDWFCAPRFDSPSVFGALLDSERGGVWTVEPDCAVASRRQFYFPDTNILITRVLTGEGMVEVQDFMPVLRERDTRHRQRLVRRVVSVRGGMRLVTRIAPRLDYGRAVHRVERVADGVRFVSDHLTLRLAAGTALTVDGPDATAGFSLAEGEAVLFVLEVEGAGGGAAAVPSAGRDGRTSATATEPAPAAGPRAEPPPERTPPERAARGRAARGRTTRPSTSACRRGPACPSSSRTRRSCSRRPSASGEAGSPSPATADGGGRWSTAPRSP